MKSIAVLSVLALIALSAPSASAARYTATASDPSGDLAKSRAGASFENDAKGSVDVTRVRHEYAGESDSLRSTVTVDTTMRALRGYRQVVDLSYAWGASKTALVRLTHRYAGGFSKLDAAVTGDVPGWCDTASPFLSGNGRKISASLRLGCFSSATPEDVDVDVDTMLLKRAKKPGDNVSDAAKRVDVPLPAAFSGPGAGDVTQPDAAKDTTLLSGTKSGSRIKETTDLRKVVFSQDAQTLRVSYCTTRSYTFGGDSTGSFTCAFYWPGSQGVESQLMVRREGASAPTATYDDGGARQSLEAFVEGTCTIVDVPKDLLPESVNQMKVNSISKVTKGSTYYDRTPETTLQLTASPTQARR